MESNGWVDFTVTRGPIRGVTRNKVGLILRLKTRPDVEEFMSSLAEGRRVPVEAHGDGWYNCNADEKALEVYDVNLEGANRVYTTNAIGSPLLIVNDGSVRRLVPGSNGEDQVNLSFLKLAGISEAEGVSVGFVGAYSADYVARIRRALPDALSQFLKDYLVPMTINLQIYSKG